MIKGPTPRLANLDVKIRPRPDAETSRTPTVVSVDHVVLAELSAVASDYDRGGAALALDTVRALNARPDGLSELTVQMAVQLLAERHPELLELLGVTRLGPAPFGPPTVDVVAQTFREAVEGAKSLTYASERMAEISPAAQPAEAVNVLASIGRTFGSSPFELLTAQLPQLEGYLNHTTDALNTQLDRGSLDEVGAALTGLAMLRAVLPNATVPIRISSARHGIVKDAAHARLAARVENGSYAPEVLVVAMLGGAAAGLSFAEINATYPDLKPALAARANRFMRDSAGSSEKGRILLALHRIASTYPEIVDPELDLALRCATLNALGERRAGVAVDRVFEKLADPARTAIEFLGRGDADGYLSIARRWPVPHADASGALSAWLDRAEAANNAGAAPARHADRDAQLDLLATRHSLVEAFPEHAARINDLARVHERG